MELEYRLEEVCDGEGCRGFAQHSPNNHLVSLSPRGAGKKKYPLFCVTVVPKRHTYPHIKANGLK